MFSKSVAFENVDIPWQQQPWHAHIRIPNTENMCRMNQWETLCRRQGRWLTIRGLYSLIRTILLFWRRRWHPTPVLLPGKSYGQRSLVGCSPWGRKESDMTERLPFHFSLSCIGEGNGNPLQCSCLENPRAEGAWWAAIYGVAKSRTRLKRLSSSRGI